MISQTAIIFQSLPKLSLQGLHPVTPALKASNRAVHKRKGTGRQSSTNRRRNSGSHGVGGAGSITQASAGLDALLAAGSAAAAERVQLLLSACIVLFLLHQWCALRQSITELRHKLRARAVYPALQDAEHRKTTDCSFDLRQGDIRAAPAAAARLTLQV